MQDRDRRKPFKMIPYTTNYIWGGTKLIEEWGKHTGTETLAEAWELSMYPEKESMAYNGFFEGKKLSEIYNQAPELFGDKIKKYEKFPILIKLINSETPLSVQVHPDDDYALTYEGELGKTEIWYVVEADKDAYIYIGLKETLGKKDFQEVLTGSKILTHLNKIPVKKGDFFLVEPGTIHALGPGLVVLEVQENSNLTYRLYDYDRVDHNGKKRELHIDKALEVSNLKKYQVRQADEEKQEFQKELVINKYFSVYAIEVLEEISLSSEDSFISLTILEGSGIFESGLTAQKGDTCFIPAKTAEKLSNLGDYPLKLIVVKLGNQEV